MQRLEVSGGVKRSKSRGIFKKKKYMFNLCTEIVVEELLISFRIFRDMGSTCWWYAPGHSTLPSLCAFDTVFARKHV